MRPSLIVSLVLLAGGCTVTVQEPDLEGQDVHLTVLHTADLHSRFFPYYFAPGQIDKGLGLIPKPGGDTAVVGGIGRVSRVIKCVRGFYSGIDCDGITEDSVTKNADGTLRCPNCKALAHIAGDPAARSVHLDSGDIFEGAPVFNLFQGEVEMRAMSEIGLSAMALGNHEFDKGSVNLELQKSKWGGFPILAANYIFSDPSDPTQPKLRDVIRDYTIVDVNGLKIGVVGLGNLSSLTGIIEGGNTLGVTPIEAQRAITQAVEFVRPQVDILALVSHLGLDEDEGVASGAAEAQDQNAKVAVDGVDLIFGGHLHIVLDPPKDLPHINTQSGAVSGHTVLCHSGAFAKYVGRLDLVVHIPTYLEAHPTDGSAPLKGSINAYTYTLIPIDDSIVSDPVMDNMLEPYLLKMNEFLNLGQVYAAVACPVGQATCPKTQRNDPNGGDSQLGNLVATSMRLRQDVQADFGLTNSLGIRADFESGPLNLEEMYNVFPFDNTITTMFLSGDEVQQMLDFVAARSSERGCRTQAQVSGIYFDAHCNTDDQDCNDRLGGPYPCAKNIFLGDACRMPDGTFNGTHCAPLQKFAEYRVAVNDYIAQGGSGFAVLKRNTTKFNTGISLRDSLVDYIRTLPTYEQDRCSPDVLAMKRAAVCDPTQNTNILGVFCKDRQGETYDCTLSCSCPSMPCHGDAECGAGGKCIFTSGCGSAVKTGVCWGSACPSFGGCAGTVVTCNGADCTNDSATAPGCCCHDQQSGPTRCSKDCPKYQACVAANRNPVVNNFQPKLYDFTDSACLDQLVQSHDGRIQMYTGSGM
jgi:5'-nucleotidase